MKKSFFFGLIITMTALVACDKNNDSTQNKGENKDIITQIDITTNKDDIKLLDF
jgi:hypothetical protein